MGVAGSVGTNFNGVSIFQSFGDDPVFLAQFSALALPPSCGADIDCDGGVNGADLGALLSAWGAPGPSDIDQDGTTGGADLGILLSAWTG
jgi:hypothetical protein